MQQNYQIKMKRQHLFKSNINIYFICIFPFQTNLYKKFFISTSSYISTIQSVIQKKSYYCLSQQQ